MHVIRVATQNIWQYHENWPARREVLRNGFARLDADLLAFQEAFGDQPRELVGDGYEIAHDAASGVAVASRWPIAAAHELEFDSLVAEIEAPLGRMVFVNHCPSYQLDNERAREEQAAAVTRLVEELRREHAILAGDLNAPPDSASVRFLRGLQSLDGMSVAYRDVWSSDDPGHTFTPENPTMPTGEKGEWLLEPGRRIDYILVRCSAHGPTLDIRSCARLFDKPVHDVWASDHFGVTAELATHLPDGRPVP